jgi:hypothetical protein
MIAGVAAGCGWMFLIYYGEEIVNLNPIEVQSFS